MRRDLKKRLNNISKGKEINRTFIYIDGIAQNGKRIGENIAKYPSNSTHVNVVQG